MRQDIISRKDEILSWIEQQLPITKIAKNLNCKLDTLKKYFKLLGIEYKGQQNKKGQKKGGNDYKEASNYLVNGSSKISTVKLKNKLLREGIKEAKCECCGNTVWLGEPIPLELHHIDGDRLNNTIENLQILCPNCHARTDNYRGKNMKVVRDKRMNEGLMKLENITGLNPVASACGFDSRSPHHLKNHNKWSKSLDEHNKLARLGKIDSLGRTNEYYLSDNEWEERKQLIVNSGIDLTKFGWKTKVQQKTGLTRRQLDNVVDHFKDYFKDKVYIR